MDRSAFINWVEGYIRAWNSNEPQEIGALFSSDASYYTGPFDEPWSGREVIIDEWLGRKDEPGSYTFEYELVATEGDLGIIRALTRYLNPPREYSNIWFIKLNESGESVEFIEWWMKKKK
jgi:hypothetical protein